MYKLIVFSGTKSLYKIAKKKGTQKAVKYASQRV